MSISILNQGNSFGISSSSSSGIVTTFVFDSTGLGNIGIGTTIFTGTANQNLQVGGGAYVAGAVGVGTTNPTGVKLDVVGNARVSGTVTFTQSATDSFLVTVRSSPTTDMVNISNLGFPVTTAGVNNLQVDFSGGSAAVEAGAVRVGMTPGGTSGGIWNAFRILPTASAGAGVTVNALKCDSITPGSGNDNALFVGSGWDQIINFNFTPIINGVGEFVSRINSLSGVSTFGSGSTVLIGGGTSTGTASQPLQVTGNAYVSGNLGIGTTIPSVTGSTLGVAGTITEFYGGTYWNLVSQYDVGIGASQVPLNQFFGQLAYMDAYSPSGLRRDGGGSDDLTIDSSGFVGIGTTNAQGLFQVGSSFTTPFIVTQSGTTVSVGIGTTNPKTSLDVVGAGNFTGIVTASVFNGNLNSTGVSTASNIGGTTLNYPSGFINVGVVTNISGTTLNYPSGFINIGVVTAISGTNLNYTGIGTIKTVGLGTVGVTTASNVSTVNISTGTLSQVVLSSTVGVATVNLTNPTSGQIAKLYVQNPSAAGSRVVNIQVTGVNIPAAGISSGSIVANGAAWPAGANYIVDLMFIGGNAAANAFGMIR
jgi:hypothetical protein